MLHLEGVESHTVRLVLPSADLKKPVSKLLKAFAKSYGKKAGKKIDASTTFKLATFDGCGDIEATRPCSDCLGVRREVALRVLRLEPTKASEPTKTSDPEPTKATTASSSRPPRVCSCEVCGVVSRKTLRCSRCNTGSYCGSACFRKAWAAGHRKACGGGARRPPLPEPLPLSDPMIGGFSVSELLGLARGPCPEDHRAAVRRDEDAWPDAAFWAKTFRIDVVDMLWQCLPESRDLLARISDVAFRGAAPGLRPIPRPAETKTRPLAHPYFPDFIDRVSDRAAKVVLDAVRKGQLAPDAKLLEVGCGNGRFLRSLKARCPTHKLRVTGVDVREDDLDLARASPAASSPRPFDVRVRRA